jgi:hypothetical protein
MSTEEGLILGDSLLPTEGSKLWYVEMPAK